MKKWLLLLPLLMLAQDPAPQNPSVEIKGIQAISVTDSEGGGENVYLQIEGGLIGPFLKLPSLPRGVGYAGTEVGLPTWPGEPCSRGNWAQNDTHLYMCVSVPVEVSATHTRWRRVAWDTSWDATPAPE